MWLGVLGPLLIRDGDADLQVSAGKQRIVLAALLARPNQVVSFDALAELVWTDGPTDSARPTIRNYVRRLRQVLGPHLGERLVTREPGYLFEIGDDEYDQLAFARLFRDGIDATQRGAWVDAEEALDAALALWRGEALVDIASPALRLREVPRLTEMRLQATELRIDARLRLGRAPTVLADLRQLVREHPLRERFHAQLMLALYATGRQGEALAGYQAAHRLLAEELGVAPGPELRALHGRILHNDPGLTEPAVRTTPAVVPHQLPPVVAQLSGRAEALTALAGLLDPHGPGLVAISGPAGVGKTALALRWAHDAAGHFPDGRVYVDLRGFDPAGQPVAPGEAIRGVLDAFEVPPHRIPADLPGRSALYRSLIAGRRALVVLDNAHDAAQVRPLLPGGPVCRVVVTSRAELAGLVAVDGARPLRLDVLTEIEANELLERRLDPERVAGDPVAVAELARLCGRLPLALSIVAARAVVRPQLPLAAFVAELREARLDALDTGDAAADVRSVFSWSRRDLTPAAARLFRLLGLHPAPTVSLDAAASLAGTDRAGTRRALAELASRHLVTDLAPHRYRLHDLLHAYAAELAQDEPDRDPARRRLFDHYLATAETAIAAITPTHEPIRPIRPAPGVTATALPDEAAARTWLHAEHATLLAVIDRAGALGFDEPAWLIACTLCSYFDRYAHWSDWAQAQRLALAAVRRAGDADGEARNLRLLGYVNLKLGRPDEAGEHYAAALAAYQRLGDGLGQAHSHRGLSEVRERQGHDELALDHAELALAGYVEQGNRPGQAHALNDLGWCHGRLGRFDRAVDCCERALALHTELGDRHGAAATWDSLGYAHQHQGDHQRAAHCYRRSIEAMRALGDRFREAKGLTRLAACQREAGQPEQARVSLRAALIIFDDLDHPNAAGVRASLAAL